MRDERGIALVLALTAIVLMMALGFSLAVITSTEMKVAANYSHAREAMYAAEAALEIAVHELGTAADWNTLLAVAGTSTFVDGAPSGTRQLSDGSFVNLTEATNLENCAKPTTCSEAEMDERTENRPWGADNPRWQLFAFGRFNDVHAPGRLDSTAYMAAWIGDDPAREDGVVLVRAEAFGPGGTRKVLEAAVFRSSDDPAGAAIRPGSWREIR